MVTRKKSSLLREAIAELPGAANMIFCMESGIDREGLVLSLARRTRRSRSKGTPSCIPRFSHPNLGGNHELHLVDRDFNLATLAVPTGGTARMMFGVFAAYNLNLSHR